MHEQGKQNWGVFYSMLKILAEAMEQKYISWAPQCVAMLLLQEEHCHHLQVTLNQGTVTQPLAKWKWCENTL